MHKVCYKELRVSQPNLPYRTILENFEKQTKSETVRVSQQSCRTCCSVYDSSSFFRSRPSDHYFCSVCSSVCLCRVFLSRLWSDFDQTRTHVMCLGL